MRAVKAAAVQLSPVLYSREGTVDKIATRRLRPCSRRSRGDRCPELGLAGCLD